MTDNARRFLLAILLLGLCGTTAELFLLAHTEDASQWIPIALAGATAVLSAIVAFRPTRGSIRVFQLVMLLMIASGGLGIFDLKDVTPLPTNGCRPKKARRK